VQLQGWLWGGLSRPLILKTDIQPAQRLHFLPNFHGRCRGLRRIRNQVLNTNLQFSSNTTKLVKVGEFRPLSDHCSPAIHFDSGRTRNINAVHIPIFLGSLTLVRFVTAETEKRNRPTKENEDKYSDLPAYDMPRKS